MRTEGLDYLISWKEKIASIAAGLGLDPYPQRLEMLSEEDFAVYRLHYGFPLQLPRWRFSKKQEPFNLLDHRGLFFKIALYAHPSTAFLREKSSLEEKIFALIHLSIYRDFIERNRNFESIKDEGRFLGSFHKNQRYIESCIKEADIGLIEAKRILDSIHAIRFQEYDFLHFILREGRMTEWQKTLLQIISDETPLFLPHLENMIMYEGWAGYWYNKIIENLEMTEELREGCLRLQELVSYDGGGYISIERLGTMLFHTIAERYGETMLYEAVKEETDKTLIEKYFDDRAYEELRRACHFEKGDIGTHKETLTGLIGRRRIPILGVKEIREQDGALLLEHVSDGRELQQEYVFAILRALVNLWGNKVILKTSFNHINKLVLCDEEQNIAIKTERK